MDAGKELNGGGGNRTRNPGQNEENKANTEPLQNRAKSIHDKALEKSPSGQSEQKSTDSIHNKHKSVHKKYAHSMPPCQVGSPELAEILEAWDALPEEVRAGILAMVKVIIGSRKIEKEK